MNTKRILVTGGAGFIGGHLVDILNAQGHEITIYDVLDPQVHGPNAQKPVYIPKNVHFLQQDIRNYDALVKALKDIDVVIHLAAAVGVGQSMYQIDKYMDVNGQGTARLLDILTNKSHSVKKLLVASSNTIYGEGRYRCEVCGVVNPLLRESKQMELKDWELNCPNCGKKVTPIPTDENKISQSTSIYAYSKKLQEDMCLLIGKTYGLNTTALRFFCVYGNRQALSNPYTGVCAIFATNLLNGNAPTIYEDGLQTRDFVNVKDICQGITLAMEKPEAQNEVFNVGTGKAISVTSLATLLCNYINPKLHPQITNKFRKGDIRHCYADISKIQSKLGYVPKYNIESGIREFIDWLKQQPKVVDKSTTANEELRKKGLL